MYITRELTVSDEHSNRIFDYFANCISVNKTTMREMKLVNYGDYERVLELVKHPLTKCSMGKKRTFLNIAIGDYNGIINNDDETKEWLANLSNDRNCGQSVLLRPLKLKNNKLI